MSASTKLALEALSDDTVQCLFYAITLDPDEQTWNVLCHQINDTISTMSKGYIWHRDEFQVYIPIWNSYDKDILFQLCSTTCFGDNIEDEWFIVYLVLEISKRFPNIVIQVTDSDGDVLLIEAADFLPKWVNPDNMENRVFIYHGHMHIIPPELASLDTTLEPKNALKIIVELSEQTQCSCEIEQAILNRIGNYPEKLLENIHRAVVKIPTNLAALLTLKPSLIAPIVDAYCNHDIIDVKCYVNMNLSDCIETEVKFTKYLYAALMHSKLINNIKYTTFGNNKKSTLGLKLACGFQMIMNTASCDMLSSKEYHKFVNSLKLNGYFRNNIEGSKEYNELLEKAKQYFSIVESPVSLSLSQNISQLLASYEYKQIKDSIKGTIIEPGYNGDNDDWLNLNPEQLNEMLLSRYGKTTSLKNNDVLSPQNVTAELSSFLKQTSDFEGIEANQNEKDVDNTIDFESDQFVSCIEKMLNILSTGGNLDDAESDDDMDDVMYNDDDGDDEECDMELKARLHGDKPVHVQDSETILTNIVKSMKQEKASSGPSSNLLRTIGINKSDLLDSDDDVD